MRVSLIALIDPWTRLASFRGGQYTLRAVLQPYQSSVGSRQSAVRKVGVRCAAAALLGVILLSATPAAHEIALDVVVQAFVRPEGQRLVLLVRAPLHAMRDIAFPRNEIGFLDIARADPSLRHAAITWIGGSVEAYENDQRLPSPRLISARVSLPSDRSFATYDEAVRHLNGTALPPETQLIWDQGLLDAMFEYEVGSAQSRFSIRMGLERLGLRVVNVLRFVPATGAERVFEFEGDEGVVRLDPRWHQAAARFVWLGFTHILEGIDHLLFLFCLVIPLRRMRPLVLAVTAFTVAHSVTLIASAYQIAPGALWFPPLVETLIAMTIVYMALENIVKPSAVERRWMLTFAFGLIHGFGFSFALRERLQFAGSHLLTSLLAFNIGVEIGQLLVLALVVPLLIALFKWVTPERIGTIVLSALIAHTAWHWMVDRGSALAEYDWPVADAAFLASALWWATLFVAAAGAVWLLSLALARGRGSPARASDADLADL
jgi:hypothetical protein